MHTVISISVLTLLLALAIGCGPGRTSAATQPSPAAFDPSASNEKALASVDAMIAEIGGAEAWASVKQIQWTHKYYFDGELKSWVVHAWDIWNGRHRGEIADMTTYKAPNEENKNPDPPTFSIAMYDLFEPDSRGGVAMYGKNITGAEDRVQIKKMAYKLWGEHGYRLTVFHKLKDPGVRLEHQGEQAKMEIGEVTVCDPACAYIKVTFDPEVGKDTYWVYINTKSHMPELIEKKVQGNKLTLLPRDWTTVNGLKFPAKYLNAGVKAELFEISEIKIGNPDESLYVPQVR